MKNARILSAIFLVLGILLTMKECEIRSAVGHLIVFVTG